jgi:lysophospholipase L1-like esterase
MGQNEHGDSDFYFKGNQSHPNKEGAELWAKYLQKKVEEILI